MILPLLEEEGEGGLEVVGEAELEVGGGGGEVEEGGASEAVVAAVPVCGVIGRGEENWPHCPLWGGRVRAWMIQ